MADFRTSLGWQALQAMMAQEQRKQQAAQAQKLQDSADQDAQFTRQMSVIEGLRGHADEQHKRDIETAKVAGEVAGMRGEAAPQFDGGRLAQEAELAGAGIFEKLRLAREGKEADRGHQMKLENLRQVDDLERVRLGQEREGRLAGLFGESREFLQAAGELNVQPKEIPNLDPKVRDLISKRAEQIRLDKNSAHSKSGANMSIDMGSFMDPQKKVLADSQSELVMIDTILPQFERIRTAMDPRLFGGLGKMRNLGTAIANAISMESPPEFVKEHSRAKAQLQTESGILVSTMIKALSGLASSDQEAARIYRMALGVRTDSQGNLALNAANVEQMAAALDAYEAYALRRQNALKRNVTGIYVGQGQDPRQKDELSPEEAAELQQREALEAGK